MTIAQNSKQVKPAKVPSVERFLEKKEELESVMKEIRRQFPHLDRIVHDYNAAIEESDKVLRPKRQSCGPFECYRIDTKYDAERLFSEVGPDEFKRLGGTVTTVPKYQVDENKLERHIVMGKMNDSVLLEVRKTVANYHKPEKVVLP